MELKYIQVSTILKAKGKTHRPKRKQMFHGVVCTQHPYTLTIVPEAPRGVNKNKGFRLGDAGAREKQTLGHNRHF